MDGAQPLRSLRLVPVCSNTVENTIRISLRSLFPSVDAPVIHSVTQQSISKPLGIKNKKEKHYKLSAENVQEVV